MANTKFKGYSFNFEELEESINYFSKEPLFWVDGDQKLTLEKIEADGHDEDEYPFDIKDVKKLGYKAEYEILECSDVYGEDPKMVVYHFNLLDDEIMIESDDFSIKECFNIIALIQKQIDCEGGGSFITFMNSNDDESTIYHEDATICGMWWEDFHKLFEERLASENKLKNIRIFRADAKAPEEKYQKFYNKRLICIELE